MSRDRHERVADFVREAVSHRLDQSQVCGLEFELVQTDDYVFQLWEYNQNWRQIAMNKEHSPDAPPTWYGNAVGKWDGDTLVVDTKYFPGHHHWLDQGGASVPASEDLHIVERFRVRPDGALDIEYAMTDPKNWEGEWKMTKTFRRRDDTDITEVQCLPDLNDRLPATQSKKLVK